MGFCPLGTLYILVLNFNQIFSIDWSKRPVHIDETRLNADFQHVWLIDHGTMKLSYMDTIICDALWPVHTPRDMGYFGTV